MNTQNIIILLILIIIFFYIYFVKNKTIIEKFTTEQQHLAEILLNMFKNNQIPTFTKYLNILIDNKNTDDNLLSKSVYNKLNKKEFLKIEDILNEMK